MERKYRVKLNADHSANEHQIADGYLGHEGRPILYSRGQAQKKAYVFSGKLEYHKPRFDIGSMNTVQIDESQLSDRLLELLHGRQLYNGVDTLKSVIFSSAVVSDLLEEWPTKYEDKDVKEELEELYDYLGYQDLIQVINLKRFR